PLHRRHCFNLCSLLFLLLRTPPRSPLFPYTTLFRSGSTLGRTGWCTIATPSAVCTSSRRSGCSTSAKPCEWIRVWCRLQTSTKLDRKSTRLNSSHDQISYAVFCLKKKKKR